MILTSSIKVLLAVFLCLLILSALTFLTVFESEPVQRKARSSRDNLSSPRVSREFSNESDIGETNSLEDELINTSPSGQEELLDGKNGNSSIDETLRTSNLSTLEGVSKPSDSRSNGKFGGVISRTETVNEALNSSVSSPGSQASLVTESMSTETDIDLDNPEEDSARDTVPVTVHDTHEIDTTTPLVSISPSGNNISTFEQIDASNNTFIPESNSSFEQKGQVTISSSDADPLTTWTVLKTTSNRESDTLTIRPTQYTPSQRTEETSSMSQISPTSTSQIPTQVISDGIISTAPQIHAINEDLTSTTNDINLTITTTTTLPSLVLTQQTTISSNHTSNFTSVTTTVVPSETENFAKVDGSSSVVQEISTESNNSSASQVNSTLNELHDTLETTTDSLINSSTSAVASPINIDKVSEVPMLNTSIPINTIISKNQSMPNQTESEFASNVSNMPANNNSNELSKNGSKSDELVHPNVLNSNMTKSNLSIPAEKAITKPTENLTGSLILPIVSKMEETIKNKTELLEHDLESLSNVKIFTEFPLDNIGSYEEMLLRDGTSLGCLYEDREKFRVNSMTTFSWLDAEPTMLLFSKGSSCVGIFRKSGEQSLRNIRHVLPEFPKYKADFMGVGYLNGQVVIFDNVQRNSQSVWLFSQQNETNRSGMYSGPVKKLTNSSFLRLCNISQSVFPIKALIQVSSHDPSCVIFDDTREAKLSANASKEAMEMANAIRYVLDKEYLNQVQSVFSWQDEDFIRSIYIYGTNGQIYEVFRHQDEGGHWEPGKYRVLPYENLPVNH